jgi:hypothetical protein
MKKIDVTKLTTAGGSMPTYIPMKKVCKHIWERWVRYDKKEIVFICKVCKEKKYD